MYDAIVIGGGHNGLTCAAYLARGGHRVLVLESRAVAGGLCTSEETVGEAPGFVMNTAALDLVITSIPRSVIDELRLADHGFRTVRADPWGGFVNPDGASIALWRDQGRSVAEIARFSRPDAERFDRILRTLGDVWWAAVPYLQGHPTRPGARTIAEALWRATRVRRSLRPGARLLLSSPGS